MLLSELSDIVGGEIIGEGETEISGLSFNSLETKEGDLFFCLEGRKFDGHSFAKEALRRGSRALAVKKILDLDVAQVLVPGKMRDAMALMSAHFYSYPEKSLSLIAVTGTNGKTSTIQLLKHCIERTGNKCGALGTLENVRTTPEAPVIYAKMREALLNGSKFFVFEASSHALDQGRLGHLQVDRAVFLNLTHDHLDYHENMESYFLAKRKLFLDHLNGLAVVNVSDKYGKRLFNELKALHFQELDAGSKVSSEKNGVIAINPYLKSDGKSAISIQFPYLVAFGQKIKPSLGGTFGLENASMVAALGATLDLDYTLFLKGLETAPQIPGRYERINIDYDAPSVIVDFAHTPSGLESVLISARRETKGSLIVVFGCGGERDIEKRPLMGKIALKYADSVIVTSDNPRSEDPHSIATQVISSAPECFQVILDRAEAIDEAISRAKVRDTVVIAGKGHEDYQEISGQKYPFSDQECAGKCLEKYYGVKP